MEKCQSPLHNHLLIYSSTTMTFRALLLTFLFSGTVFTAPVPALTVFFLRPDFPTSFVGGGAVVGGEAVIVEEGIGSSHGKVLGVEGSVLTSDIGVEGNVWSPAPKLNAAIASNRSSFSASHVSLVVTCAEFLGGNTRVLNHSINIPWGPGCTDAKNFR